MILIGLNINCVAAKINGISWKVNWIVYVIMQHVLKMQ
jgi:hypothetical protein